MTNHFHVVAYVPDMEELSDEEVLRRVRILYSGTRLAEKLKEWNAARAAGPSSVARLKVGYCRRMRNASEFMKTLKQHCTMSFSGRRDHSGTMWESRFRVRVCEPEEMSVREALAEIARGKEESASLAEGLSADTKAGIRCEV